MSATLPGRLSAGEPVRTESAPRELFAGRSRSVEVSVPANALWTETGCEVAVGETLTILADGRFVASCRDEFGQGTDAPCGPEGRFDVPRGIARQKFPLAAGSHGPAPCFCLIGRIGDGEPFFVGRRMSLRAKKSGHSSWGSTISPMKEILESSQFLSRLAVRFDP